MHSDEKRILSFISVCFILQFILLIIRSYTGNHVLLKHTSYIVAFLPKTAADVGPHERDKKRVPTT